MNGFNPTTIGAIIVAVLSVLLNYTGRQKYKDNTSFFEQSNHELREQNTTFRDEISTLKQQLVQAQTESTQKDKIITQLKPFSEVAKIVSNNHKEVMQTMTNNFADVMKVLTEKIDGKH